MTQQLKLYSKTKEVTPETLALFLQYANDAPNWTGSPLVGGNCPGDFAALGRISHMKMAGLVTTEFQYDKVNNRKTKLTWMYFTEAGRALAAKHGVDSNLLAKSPDHQRDNLIAERVAEVVPAPVAADIAKTEETAAAPRITLRAVKTFQGMEGTGFNADVYVDGEKAGSAIDDASGRPDLKYRWVSPALELKVRAVVGAMPPEKCPADAEDWMRELYDENGLREVDLDTVVAGLVEEAVIEKQLARYRRTDVLYTTPECTDGEFFRVKHGGDVEGAKAQVLAKVPNAKFI